MARTRHILFDVLVLFYSITTHTHTHTHTHIYIYIYEYVSICIYSSVYMYRSSTIPSQLPTNQFSVHSLSKKEEKYDYTPTRILILRPIGNHYYSYFQKRVLESFQEEEEASSRSSVSFGSSVRDLDMTGLTG